MSTTIFYRQATMKELIQLFETKVVKNKNLSLSTTVPKSTPTRFICITLDYTIPYSINISELTEYSLDRVIDISYDKNQLEKLDSMDQDKFLAQLKEYETQTIAPISDQFPDSKNQRFVINNQVSWYAALRKMKQLQNRYNIPLFAATYISECSCCATPHDFNEEAYLDPTNKPTTFSEISSYVVFSNSWNAGGEAELLGEFGMIYDQDFHETLFKKQFIKYRTSDTITIETLTDILGELVAYLNDLSLKQYTLKIPKDKYETFVIDKEK